ncbi:MAG: phage major capsid protein, partial [bacterium]
MTLEELILSIEVEREQAIKKRDRAVAEVKAILAKARQEGRANLSEEEETDVQSAFAKRDQAKRELEGIDTKLANAKRAKEAEDEAQQQQDQRVADPATREGAKPAYDRVARVGAEERTYHQGNCARGGQFIRDVVSQFLYRDLEAEGRLTRHMQEERVERGQYLTRDVGTGSFGGLVVPQFLTDMYAPKVRAKRPFADAINSHDLPAEGMEVTIPRIDTGSTVDTQASENADVEETNIDADNDLTFSVKTAAGQQSLSRQFVDRSRGGEDVVMDDLQRAWAANLDSKLLNESSTGLTSVATSVTFDATTPTGVLLYPKVLEALSGAEGALLGFANPDIAVMHSRRWHWLNSELTDQHPLVSQPQVPGNAAAVNLAEVYGQGFAGILPNGLVVIKDNNVRTDAGSGDDEDEVYVLASEEAHLWEDPNAPQFIRAEQAKAAQLSVLLVLYSYYAYTFQRLPHARKISGTGLVTPTFG